MIFFLPLALSVVSLRVTPLRAGMAAPFYSSTCALLGAHWLMEPRYAIVPFALLGLLRERRGRAVEWLSLLWGAALSFWLL